MPEQLHSAEEWRHYAALYDELYARLREKSWFTEGWKVECRHVPAGNRVIFVLTKYQWCEGAIHFKTRLTNSDLQKGLTRVGLHVETSIPKHGINRVLFCNILLEQSGAEIQKWEGYVIKPLHHQKPFYTWIPFTTDTLVSGLVAEFSRLHKLAQAIELAIKGASVMN